MQLVSEIYELTKEYPKEELYSLISQTRRAAISIPANIAEGIGRNYKKDPIQFLYIARGSLYELETLLMIALNAGILLNDKFNTVYQIWEKSIQLLNGLINYYEKSNLK